ncbi:AprI/Inh family metalloprotease inhibitor [Pseudomonas sp. SDO528_S397]
MANSLQLANAPALAGQWQAYLQSESHTRCSVALGPDKTLGGDLDCLAGWLEQPPAGWFPEPDGVSLTDAQGSRLLHLGKQQEGVYQSLPGARPVLVLRRKDAP